MEPTASARDSAKAEVAAMFDALALEYARTRERGFSFQAQKRLVVEMLADARGRILEVGCGPALMSPALAAMGFEVHGLDVSGEMVRRARQRMSTQPLANRCRFAVGDVERLAHPDAFFDAVLAMGVLEYLASYDAALHAVARVLKPGGLAVLTVPNQLSAYHLARSAFELARRGARRLRGHAAGTAPDNRCIPWALDRQLARAGLRKVDSAACNFILFGVRELMPRTSERLNRALSPAARSPFASVLGAQYVVKARRQA